MVQRDRSVLASPKQGLLKEQLEVVKYKTEAGVLRYTIRPLDVELPFDKVRCRAVPWGLIVLCPANTGVPGIKHFWSL